jgi:hypothetical protein
MSRLAILVALGLAVVACTKQEPPPKPALITPNSKLLYEDGQGHGVFTYCSGKDRVFMSHAGQFQVIGGGCPTGEP